jgi:hypothetical protein
LQEYTNLPIEVGAFRIFYQVYLQNLAASTSSYDNGRSEPLNYAEILVEIEADALITQSHS